MALPSGRVTFAFTDVVGSTQAFAEHGDAYVEALGYVQGVVAAQTRANGGEVVGTEGDGAFLAFWTPQGAVAALLGMQRVLEEEPQPGLRLRLRAGAHIDEAAPIDDDYLAFGVHVAARVSGTAGAGQVVVSSAVVDALGAPVGEEVGAFALKDIAEPAVLWRLAGDPTPLRATPARRTNAAVPRTSFVGREAELEFLRARARNPGLVTVVGPGGLGKTRLVTELALRGSDDLGGGAWLVELAPLEEPGQILNAAAAALGGSEPSLDGLVAELRRRGEVLLVLDNCEHLIDASADLAADLLERCPQLRLVCTSREPLEIDGERVLRIEPLAASADGSGEAEQLFLSRAAAAGAELGEADLDAVSRVCTLLDGLPLALELAAARAPSAPISELADALAAGELELQRRGGERRQRSLRALVEWSLRLLEPAERTTLLVLSVFPGRFSAADARELLGGVAGTHSQVTALARRSLVDLDGDRYRILLTIREVARSELAQSPDVQEAAFDSLYEWALRGCPPPGVRSTEPEEFDVILAVEAALSWALRAGKPTLGPLMRRLRSWAHRAGGNPTIGPIAKQILARPVPDTVDEVLLQACALEVVTGLGFGQTDLGPVMERVEKVLAAARELNDLPTLHEAVSGAAAVFAKDSRTSERALELHLEALELASTVPQLAGVRPLELGNLGAAYYFAGDLGNAEHYMREAIDAAAGAGDESNVAVNRCNLAELLLDTNRPEAAAEVLRAVLAAPHVPIATPVAMGLLVEAEAALGADPEAHALAGEANRELQRLCAGEPSLVPHLERLQRVLAGTT
jgi:predicted ATPase/class 3 adenylate cyclase